MIFVVQSVVVVAALAGCGGGSSRAARQPTATNSPATSGNSALPSGPTPSPATSGTGSPSPAGATVGLRTGSLGTYLVGPNGKTLYVFDADTTNTSNCNGTCAAAWPPLTITGTPQAGHGLSGVKLITIGRSNGAKQVAYFGHPLYYFAGDLQPKATNGQCLSQFGGLWHVVGADGNKLGTC